MKIAITLSLLIPAAMIAFGVTGKGQAEGGQIKSIAMLAGLASWFAWASASIVWLAWRW